MKLKRGITEAAAEVKNTAEKIGTSVEWQTLALIAVTAVSVMALAVGCAALARSAK